MQIIIQAILLFLAVLGAYYIGQQETHNYYIKKAKYRRQLQNERNKN